MKFIAILRHILPELTIVLRRNRPGFSLAMMSQSLGTRSNNTMIADPGSPYVAAFQCTFFLPFTSCIFYRLSLCQFHF